MPAIASQPIGTVIVQQSTSPPPPPPPPPLPLPVIVLQAVKRAATY